MHSAEVALYVGIHCEILNILQFIYLFFRLNQLKMIDCDEGLSTTLYLEQANIGWIKDEHFL